MPNIFIKVSLANLKEFISFYTFYHDIADNREEGDDAGEDSDQGDPHVLPTRVILWLDQIWRVGFWLVHWVWSRVWVGCIANIDHHTDCIWNCKDNFQTCKSVNSTVQSETLSFKTKNIFYSSDKTSLTVIGSLPTPFWHYLELYFSSMTLNVFLAPFSEKF